jgi:hypothetical protein
VGEEVGALMVPESIEAGGFGVLGRVLSAEGLRGLSTLRGSPSG